MLNLQINIGIRGKSKWEALVSALFCAYLIQDAFWYFRGSAVGLCVYPGAEVGRFFQWWKITLDELLDSSISLNRLLQCSSATDFLTP